MQKVGIYERNVVERPWRCDPQHLGVLLTVLSGEWGSSGSESASKSKIRLPIYINNWKLLHFYWTVTCALCLSVVYMSITARVKGQRQTFALPLTAGMHGQPFPPLPVFPLSLSLPLSLHRWMIRLSPHPPLCDLLFASTHPDYLLMHLLTFRALFLFGT